MPLAELTLGDLIGTFLGFVLTILILSYLIGDNPLFRFAIHLFIGVAAGYTSIITLQNIILPHLVYPFLGDETGKKYIAFLLLLISILLLTKINPRMARWSNGVMGFLVGIGVAATIGGSINGTLFPQVAASINSVQLQENTVAEWQKFGNSIIILLGTITTMAYFHFGVKKKQGQPLQRIRWIEGMGQVGQIFLGITLGALFAGVYAAAATALIERLSSLWNFLKELVLPILNSS